MYTLDLFRTGVTVRTYRERISSGRGGSASSRKGFRRKENLR